MDESENKHAQLWIREILKPLQQENSSSDYFYQFKSINAFDQEMRSLETIFKNLYTQIIEIEDEILNLNKNLNYHEN
jgi:DNA topoisomerase VI subunit B